MCKNELQISLSFQNHERFQTFKFMYSEKATKFREISTVDFSYAVAVKSMMEILQNFVASSEYMNFKARNQ